MLPGNQQAKPAESFLIKPLKQAVSKPHLLPLVIYVLWHDFLYEVMTKEENVKY